MAKKSNRVLFWGVTGLVLVGTVVPYLLAYQAAGPGYVFGGFLVNPIDGHTYLAKMVQGAAGGWRFTLPYTAEPGQGAYLNLYYLALGHLAALTGLSNMIIYQAARLAGSVFMLGSLYRFLWSLLEDERARRFAFVLAALGSGLGWLAAPFGGFTADFWVAEAYPFLSALTNPHFPLGLGLLLWVLSPPSRDKADRIPAFVWAVVLGLVAPFGLVVALGVLGGLYGLFLLGWVEAPWVTRRFLAVASGGSGILLYDFWAIQRDPVLAGWNAQNLTLTPAPLDLVLSFSPAFLMAVAGIWMVLKKRRKGIALLAFWVVLVLILIYLPINLQRRLLTGYYVPVAALAAVWLSDVAGEHGRWYGRIAAITVAGSVLTNVFILVAGVFGAQTHDPLLFIRRAEADAFHWINTATAREAVILASPATGLWIPSQTGRRVLYGHPFETVDAEAEEAAVREIFQGDWPAAEVRSYLQKRGVRYIFIGPQERALGEITGLDGYPVVYENQEVRIYSVPYAESGP